MRKLVELDPESLRFTEVDPKRVRREALRLAASLKLLDPADDRWGVRRKIGRIVKRVLAGQERLPLVFPFHGLTRQCDEDDHFPRAYADVLFDEFWMTASGGHRKPPVIFEKDGKKYAEMEFED
jgi:hypothetical protein